MKFLSKKIKNNESVDTYVARGGEIKKIKTKIPKQLKYLIKKEEK